MLGLFIWLAHLEAMVVIGMLVFYVSLSTATRTQIGFRPAILALAMPPIAFALPMLGLLHVVYFLIVPIFAQRRSQIVPIYVFALLLLPDFKTPLTIGSVFLFYGTIYDSLGFGALLTMLMRFPARSRIRGATDIPAILIVLVFMVCRGRDASITNMLRIGVETLLAYGLPYFIASRGVRSIDDLKRVMLHMACAGVMIAVIMSYETLRTWPLYRILHTHYGIELSAGNAVKLRGGWLRATGTTTESTSMAFVMVPCILATICSRRAFVSAPHYIGLMCLLCVGLFMPQSRGALVGLVFGIAVMSIYVRQRAVVVGVAFMALCLAVATMVAPAESRLGGMLGKSAETVGTADYRKDLFVRGMEEFRKRPIFGNSEKGMMANLEDLRQGEGIIDFVNTYLYVALASGAIGLILFAIGLISPAMALWNIRAGLSENKADLRMAGIVFAAIVVLIEMIAFTALAGRPTTFAMMFIAFAAAVVSERRYAAATARLAGPGQRAPDERPTAAPLIARPMPEVGEWREPFPLGMKRSS